MSLSQRNTHACMLEECNVAEQHRIGGGKGEKNRRERDTTALGLSTIIRYSMILPIETIELLNNAQWSELFIMVPSSALDLISFMPYLTIVQRHGERKIFQCLNRGVEGNFCRPPARGPNYVSSPRIDEERIALPPPLLPRPPPQQTHPIVIFVFHDFWERRLCPADKVATDTYKYFGSPNQIQNQIRLVLLVLTDSKIR